MPHLRSARRPPRRRRGGLTVTCRHCGEFQVSDEALNALLRLDLPHRTQALQDAKRAAPPGERPHITPIAGPTRRGLSRFFSSET